MKIFHSGDGIIQDYPGSTRPGFMTVTVCYWTECHWNSWWIPIEIAWWIFPSFFRHVYHFTKIGREAPSSALRLHHLGVPADGHHTQGTTNRLPGVPDLWCDRSVKWNWWNCWNGKLMLNSKDFMAEDLAAPLAAPLLCAQLSSRRTLNSWPLLGRTSAPIKQDG